MAIRVQTTGATDLRVTTDIVKRNLNTAITIAGTSGKVAGFWQAVFLQIPASGFNNGAALPLLAADGSGGGIFNGTNDHVFAVGGDNAANGTFRLKPRVHARSGGTAAFAATTQPFANLPALTRAANTHLLLWGISNTGTDAAPVWQGWSAMCRVGGDASSEVIAAPITAGYLSAATGILLRQVFHGATASTSTHTPAGTILQHAAHCDGDFPWDTANNRPHHAALLALANGTGAGTLHTYASLVAAQNAGSLGYGNLRGAAKADLTHWWTLADLTAGGLANNGSNSANALAVTNWNTLSGGLDGSAATIAPTHWAGAVPAITEPAVKFHGGRGARALVVAGTHTGPVQRRWVNEAAGTSLAGFDWAGLTVTAGAWQTSDVLPVGGPYRLEVRDTAVPANLASSADWLVGTVMLTHAQSAMQLTWTSGGTGTTLGVNRTNTVLSAGAQGVLLRLGEIYGGEPTAYLQPSLAAVRLIGGQTPVCGQGSVACLNEWNAHNPGHPLLIANMAIEGSFMSNWASNQSLTVHRAGTGHASWFYMGTIGAVAGASSGNNSGVVETYAALLRRHVDVHTIMWSPNMGLDSTVRADYVAGIDARFSNAASAPWLVIPPWRMHRNPTDTVGSVGPRDRSVLFFQELGARGVLGPQWADNVDDSDGSGHGAYANPAGTPSFQPVPDTNMVGVSRGGATFGRALAWVFDRTIKANGPRLVAAWSDNGRATVQIELGRTVRTLGGAAIYAAAFEVSTNNGAAFTSSGFTVALAASGTRAVLTPADGGTAWAAAGANLRVDYARVMPFHPDINPQEMNTERLLDGLL
ncbi:hypothetical protein, partial [Sandarakinorhabdus sp.]|uniref:hypothetical protein n=1 Tax=Sandarakinorhabdus sp. TaxID=1916663 RepID=UPI0033418308